MPIRLTLRLDFANGHRLGPGKVRLLEAIDEHGSISAAGRALGMSYRRAWLLLDEINRAFTQPAVAGQTGGSGGGGTALTDWGRELVTLYRGLEASSTGAGVGGLERIDAMLNPAEINLNPQK
ncbi:LysR family transcriptional regulator [Niveispirillum sp. SYP-B3756]|uniref:winged helix-turn-helix domain-containing protein n=1 Tax=Niveispirillum sp. SYP-B3756 TaxID=2662178 RepID=UPI001290F45C|nr:LysR family transcriptional regulator [Niveispirillum sp. SYP-B3756]MQP64473.1 LysR family transcriptional regulator [Niveispirillum sp. SYP-B3756]